MATEKEYPYKTEWLEEAIKEHLGNPGLVGNHNMALETLTVGSVYTMPCTYTLPDGYGASRTDPSGRYGVFSGEWVRVSSGAGGSWLVVPHADGS